MAEQFVLLTTYSGLVGDVVSSFKQDVNWSADDLRVFIQTKCAAAQEACSNYSMDQIQQALFAVCAWLDSYLMANKWPGMDDWRKNLLQDSYFQTTDAGVLFFERCQQLTEQEPELLHLYFFCLASGFRGQYYAATMRDDLQAVMQSLLKKLGQTDKPAWLTQGLMLQSTINLPHKTASRSALWFKIVAPLSVLLLTYGYFYSVIVNSVQSYLAMAT